MKSKQNNNRTGSSACSGGLWRRVRERWLSGLNLPALGLGQESEPTNSQHVKVWDRQRGCYRYVDLDDRADPLWSAAYSLASFQRESNSRRPAA